MIIVLFVVFAYAEVTMRDVSVVGASNDRKRSLDAEVAQVCRAPGGMISSSTGDCVCCPGYSGNGCASRDRCYDVSCSNGGYCDVTTGYCTCPQGWTGPRCNVPTCSYNGFYSAAKQTCVCQRGWAGSDCSTCAASGVTNAQGVSHTWTCVPNKSSRYLLMNLPTTYAQQLISGAIKADASLSYHALIPGSSTKSVDGKLLDCACNPIESHKKRITPANLDLYNQTVVDCIEASTLTANQMQELESLWATCVSLEQQGLLTNAWYIVAIIFIILFGISIIAWAVYCVFINYTRELTAAQPSRRKRTVQRKV